MPDRLERAARRELRDVRRRVAGLQRSAAAGDVAARRELARLDRNLASWAGRVPVARIDHGFARRVVGLDRR